MSTLGLGVLLGVVVGSLVAIIIGAMVINHFMKKSRMKKSRKLANEEAAMKMNSREKLVGKEIRRGSVGGSFIGAGQSRSNSPAPSYVLAPSTSLVNWGDSKSTHSASSSVTDLPRNGSISSLPMFPQAAKMKSSRLRLDSSEVPFTGRLSPSGSIGGTYMPPLPSPRSVRSFANPQASGSWVSPLDVHFSRPSTPQAPSSRPQSYLPRLQFPEDLGQSGLLVPTPAGSVGVANSDTASIISSTTAAVEPPSEEAPAFNFNFDQSELPSRAARQSTRSIFPMTIDDDRPVSRRSAKSFHESDVAIPIPAVPQGYFLPGSPGLDPDQYGDRAVMRESVVSKRSVSIYHAPASEGKSHLRAHSRVASSIYSATTSIGEIAQSSKEHSRTRSDSQPSSRNRSRSTSSKRPRSQSLSRTQDSVRRHSRKQSQTEKRRSRERDQIHYDPTSHNRDHNGSVQGRNVDFDRARASPFSNTNVVSIHSASSSLVSASSSGFPWQKAENVSKLPSLDVNLAVTDRRERTASQASQISMGFGDFYDAYYRQSTLAQTANHMSPMNGSPQDSLSVGMAVTSNVPVSANNGRRPPPLRFGGLAGETIVEVTSPVSNQERYPNERYPNMI